MDYHGDPEEPICELNRPRAKGGVSFCGSAMDSQDAEWYDDEPAPAPPCASSSTVPHVIPPSIPISVQSNNRPRMLARFKSEQAHKLFLREDNLDISDSEL